MDEVLVPDELVVNLQTDFGRKIIKGGILDGFPRTIF